MVGKKKKAKLAKALNTISKKKKKTTARVETRGQLLALNEQRRVNKVEKRRRDKQAITAEMWAAPAPSHLVARLDMPKIMTKHRTYFEIADNHEKKKKKLEYTVTNDRNPPPGFTFIPVGDPDLTRECKELSRERDAMIFIVSDSMEQHSKIAEHVHRSGYHFRESIVDDAREKVGGRVISKAPVAPNFIEPIPDTQEEMSRQAEGALMDLFPRIPYTDREQIIRHAFKKGGLFQGEPTVGNQADIPLSRRVQLAALAHIRHVHTRYDLLLRETTWMNARKAVEPVCLDILLKWRGDEETGRDQMDEILREVVVITDSEGEEESSDEEEEDESSDEDGEVTSSSSIEGSVEIVLRDEHRASSVQRQIEHNHSQGRLQATDPPTVSAQTNTLDQAPRDKNLQKGFKRYQAAFDDAKKRQKNSATASSQSHGRVPSTDMASARWPTPATNYATYNPQSQVNGARPRHALEYNGNEAPMNRAQSGHQYSQPRPTSTNIPRRDEVIMRPFSANPPYSQAPLPQLHTSSNPPQVVRGSPPKHGLQDLLVPSIEIGSNNFSSSSHVAERSGFRDERDGDFYTRRVNDHGRVSPAGRRVIVIDGDSPPAKRPRVVYEDPGHFRSGASLNRPYMQPQRLESPRLRGSVHPGEFHPSHSRAPLQPAQGSLRRNARDEQLPVYDAPDSGFFAAHPRQLGMQEVGRAPSRYGEGQQGGNSQMGRERAANFPPRDNQAFLESNRPRNMAAEPYHGASQAPNYFANGGPRHFPPHSPAVDQEFVQSFSQSHLGGNTSSFQNQAAQPQRYGESSFSNNTVPQQRYEPPFQPVTAPSIHARPPVQHMERPIQYTNAPQYEQRYEDPRSFSQHPTMGHERQRQQHDGEAPTYVRTVDPNRRNVIILD